MKRKLHLASIAVFFAFTAIIIAFAFQAEEQQPIAADPKVANLKLPAGFSAERLYGPSEHEEGSWVAMTFDHKGRIIASDQYGNLYRMAVPAIGDTISKTQVEKLEVLQDPEFISDTSKSKISIGYAHGLLYAFNSLYVMINHRGDSKLKPAAFTACRILMEMINTTKQLSSSCSTAPANMVRTVSYFPQTNNPFT